MAVWLRELTEFRWTGSGARSVQWQGIAYWLVATGYSCHGIQVLCETSHWTTVCSLCRYRPVWRLIEDLRTLSVCTDTACLPTSHNSPCVLYVEVLEATAEGSSTGDKLS
jgi:hypothetical protein